MAVYKGFSTFEFQSTKSFDLTDVELVKMDLLNHMFTRRGTRVKMPNYGTAIPDLVFEPLDGEVVEQVREELKQVFEQDPRVSVATFEVRPDFANQQLVGSARLFYVELDYVDDFELNIQFGG